MEDGIGADRTVRRRPESERWSYGELMKVEYSMATSLNEVVEPEQADGGSFHGGVSSSPAGDAAPGDEGVSCKGHSNANFGCRPGARGFVSDESNKHPITSWMGTGHVASQGDDNVRR